MTKKPQNTSSKWQSLSLVLGLAVLWQLSVSLNWTDAFILPGPVSVIRALYIDFELLMYHSSVTLSQAFIGLGISIILGYTAAICMDRFSYFRNALYPLLILSQTIPYIAVAPLLIIWFGFGMTSKIVLIVILCFFPIAVNGYDAIRGIGREYIDELAVCGGNYSQGLWFVKLPMSLPGFFSAIKIAAAYSIIGSVVSEWIGGNRGLGVYMTRVRKSYEFDKMFAAVLVISLLSLLLMILIKYLERRSLEYVRQ